MAKVDEKYMIGNPQHSNERFSRVVTYLHLLVLIVGVAYVALARRDMAAAMQDEGILLVAPERLLRGDIPNRDFLSTYGPGNIWLLAGFYKVWGVSLDTARFVGFLYQVVLVTGVYFIARRVGRFTGLVCALISAWMLVPLGTPPYAWIGGLALAMWSLAFAACVTKIPHSGENHRFLFWAGLLAAFSVTWRLDLGLALLIFYAILWKSLAVSQRKQLGWGLCCGIVPLLVHILVVSPQVFIDNCFIDPVFRFGPGRRLPLSDLHLDHQINALVITILSFVLALLAVASNRHRPALDRALGFFCVALLTQLWQRPDYMHQVYVACVIVALMPYAVANWWDCRIGHRADTTMHLPQEELPIARTRSPRSHERHGVYLAWVNLGKLAVESRRLWLAPSLLLMLSFVWPYLLLKPLTYLIKIPSQKKLTIASYEVRNDSRGFLLSSKNNAMDAQSVINFLHQNVRHGQKMFVGERDMSRSKYSDTYFYYLLPNLRPASYYLELFPHSANRVGSSLEADVANADVLVLTTQYEQWKESNTSQKSGPTVVNNVIRKRFKPVYEKGHFSIWLRNSE